MGVTCRWALAVAVFIVMPIYSQEKAGEKKADTKDHKKPALVSANKYQSVGKLAGKLLNVDTEEMTVEIEVVVPSRRSAKMEKQTHKIADDYKVRILNLPERSDNNGKVIPYGDVEKTKLRGDNPKLPGYSSEISALRPGQIVEVELSTKKPTLGAAKKKNDEPETPVATMIVIAKEAPKNTEKKK